MTTARSRHPLGQALATSAGVHVLGLVALVMVATRAEPVVVEVMGVAPVDDVGPRDLTGPPAAVTSMELAAAEAAPRTRRTPAGPRATPAAERIAAAEGALAASAGEGTITAGVPTAPLTRPQLATIGISSGESSDDEAAGPSGPRAGAPTPPALSVFLGELAEQVRGQWHPSQAYFRGHPGVEGGGPDDARALLARAAVQARATTLQVHLRGDGSLAQVGIAESSGSAPLDAEATAAFERAQPFAPPPPELLDATGTLAFHFNLRLDLSEAAYLAKLGSRLSDSWTPSPAVRRFEGFDRMTVVRARLAPDGTVIEAAVVAPSGLDLLDASALGALRPGTRLPPPPGGLARAGHADLRITFVHRIRDKCLVRAARERGPDAIADNDAR